MGINVRVIKKFNNPTLDEILPLDFETVVTAKISPFEKLIHKGITTKKIHIPAMTVPAGEYDGFTFVGANGETYDSQILYGYALNQIFKKVVVEIDRKLVGIKPLNGAPAILPKDLELNKWYTITDGEFQGAKFRYPAKSYIWHLPID